MKVLLVTMYFPPSGGGGVQRPLKFATHLPAHGIAFDTWAGLVPPAVDDEGFCYIAEHASMGIHAGPLLGALPSTFTP